MAYTPKWREHEKFYLTEPGDESCYEYMLSCYERFYEDIGEYDAFVVPVANVESATPMKKFIILISANILKSMTVKRLIRVFGVRIYPII